MVTAQDQKDNIKYLVKFWKCCVNVAIFWPTGLFLHPLKIPVKLRFSDFSGSVVENK